MKNNLVTFWAFILANALTFSAPVSNQEMMKMEDASMKKKLSQEQGAAVHTKGSSDVMIIDPSTRAKDFLEAFHYLRKQKAGSQIVFDLKDGHKISGVTDMKVMDGGSLIIFQLATTQGIKFKVVRIEDLTAIDHR